MAARFSTKHVAAVMGVTVTLGLVAASVPAADALATAPSATTRALNPGGHVHLMPTRPVARSLGLGRASVAASAVDVTYRGGPVMQAGTRTVPIFWEPATLQDGSSGAVDANYDTLIQRFLGDIGGHGLYNSLTQYFEVVGGHTKYIVNSSGFLQAVVDTTPYPAPAGPCVTNAITNCIDDDQLQAEIATDITAGSLPTDLSTMYIAFTDPMESSCFDDANCFNPENLNAWTYCAYHGSFSMAGKPVVYANLPYMDSSDISILLCGGGVDTPNGDAAFDDETAPLSHEFSEAVTDPNPGDLAWYDDANGEIGDMCVGDITDVTWGSHTYMVQKEWSNAATACVPGGNDRISLGSVSGPAGASTTVNGAHFGPSETVTLSFSDVAGTVRSLGTASTSASGTFSKLVSIPSAAAGGAGTLDATGADPGDGASASFRVAGTATHRPDAQIGASTAGPWLGNGVYNVTGSGQSLLRTVARGSSGSFWMRVQNDGNVRDTFSMKAPAAPAGFTVTYKVGTTTMTAAVVAGTYERALAAGSTFKIHVIIGVKHTAAVGAVFHAKMLATSAGDATKKDAIVGSTRAT